MLSLRDNHNNFINSFPNFPSAYQNISEIELVNYEDFIDRFSHASSPYVISQNFAGTPKNLFRIHMLSAGSGVANKFKFSIEN